MDLTTMTDLNELKAMAYDQLVIQQTTEANLRAINERIAQLTKEEADKKQSAKPVK